MRPPIRRTSPSDGHHRRQLLSPLSRPDFRSGNTHPSDEGGIPGGAVDWGSLPGRDRQIVVQGSADGHGGGVSRPPRR